MANTKTDVWMPLYIGDYLAATSHLSAIESGAYLHLLMHQWKNGSLPSDQESLRRIAKVEKEEWNDAWSIVQAFFEHSSGIPVQLKLEKIRSDWDGKKATSVAKAQAAAAKRWSAHAPSIAQAMPQPCPSPSPSPIKEQIQKHAPSEVSLEAPPVQTGLAVISPIFAQIPLNRGQHPVTEADVGMYETLYRAIDVRQEIRKMIGWCDAEPNKRKTKNGIRRFMNRWLSEAQDKAGGRNGIRPDTVLERHKYNIANIEAASRRAESADGAGGGFLSEPDTPPRDAGRLLAGVASDR